MEKEDSDSTVTSLGENTDILTEGILELFKPVVEKLDEQIANTRTAQVELKAQLDELSAKLIEIENAQTNIPEFSDKVKELINVKQKVTVITNILTTSQERLINLHKLIEKEHRRRQAFLASADNPQQLS